MLLSNSNSQPTLKSKICSKNKDFLHVYTHRENSSAKFNVCLNICCSGLFCEFSPPMVLPRTSPCDNHECLNGAQCVVVGTDPRCQCIHGYEGERCETLVSVNFVNRESYLQLPSNLLSPQTNISLQVCTLSVEKLMYCTLCTLSTTMRYLYFNFMILKC